jgi:hypothetical protein
MKGSYIGRLNRIAARRKEHNHHRKDNRKIFIFYVIPSVSVVNC